jgi:hypothetical protein
VSRRIRTVLLAGVAALITFAPAVVVAQPTPQPAAPSSSLWVVAGGAFAALRGDCQTCEEDYPYRHGGGVLVNAGYRVNPRMDVGLEMFWIPVDTTEGRIQTTHWDAVAQFRPWASRGFFLKGGSGMAYVRNWVDISGGQSVNSKALSVVIGTGWEFRPTRRIGLQIFGSQHVGALGDLATVDGLIPDVVGNFWSFGAAVVFR